MSRKFVISTSHHQHKPSEFPSGKLRWEYNIKMDLKLIGRVDVDLCQLVLYEAVLVGFCEHGSEISDSVKVLECIDELSYHEFNKVSRIVYVRDSQPVRRGTLVCREIS
jgi:hypothetical protein